MANFIIKGVNMKKILLSSAFVCSTLFASMQADAAGFHLSEYSTTGLGRAFAGMGVVGDDFSALGYNPAGMQFNKTSGAQGTLTAVSLHSDYKGDVSFTNTSKSGDGHTRITRVLPSFFGQYKINQDLTFGMGIYTPFGLATDYDNGWFGESHAGLSQVSATNLSPSVSYQINKFFSVGANLNVQYITARLTSTGEMALGGGAGMFFPGMTNDLRGDDLGLGYSLGVGIKPADNIRLGVSYRSKVEHKLHGKVKISGSPNPALVPNGKSDINAKITTPEVVLFSGAYDLNDKFTFSASARWTRWSQFKDLDIYRDRDGALISSTQENWKNTWFYSGGVDYRHTENLTLRLGMAYDETVIKGQEYRTARIPDGRRIWASVGGSYAYKNWQFDAGYTHIFLHGGRAQGGARGSSDIDIKYSSNAELLSFTVQYKF